MSESTALSLDGEWKLRDFAPGQGLEVDAHLSGHDDTDWHPASVPGDVHTALVEIGRLAPLFHNMNLETCQWVEHQEWWHRTTFKAPADREDDGARYLLTFGGLDTLATDAYAYFVRLTVPIDRTGFSDNYFDLFPSQERVIMVWNETGWRLDDNDIAVSCL